MAEIGLFASVLQVAGAGLKLSQTLYQYADSVASADRRVKDIATEVELTSRIINELGTLFELEETSRLLSQNALETANKTVRECSSVFTEIDTALTKTKKNTLGRLMLPFRESKIELLRRHIDTLKSTLQLLLQVLVHAQQVATQKLNREAEARQREQIKTLLKNKNESAKKYEESLRKYSMSEDSTVVVEDDDSEWEGETTNQQDSGVFTMSSINPNLSIETLEQCVKHIHGLLGSITTLQKALSDAEGSAQYAQHHQSAIRSYFQARGHLDGVFLGNPPKPRPGDDSVHDNSSSSGLQNENRNGTRREPMETCEQKKAHEVHQAREKNDELARSEANTRDTGSPSSLLQRTAALSSQTASDVASIKDLSSGQRTRKLADIWTQKTSENVDLNFAIDNSSTSLQLDTGANEVDMIKNAMTDMLKGEDSGYTESDLKKVFELAIEYARRQDQFKKEMQSAVETARREERARLAEESRRMDLEKLELRAREDKLKAEKMRRVMEEEARERHKLEEAQKRAVEMEVQIKKAQEEALMKAQAMRKGEVSEHRQMEAEERTKAELERRVYDEEQERASRKGTSAETERPLPITFKDAVGRKFIFPYHICNTWESMEHLIKRAFECADGMREYVNAGSYELTNAEGETILPQLWDLTIQPGSFITMKMHEIPQPQEPPHPPPPPYVLPPGVEIVEVRPQKPNRHKERSRIPTPKATTRRTSSSPNYRTMSPTLRSFSPGGLGSSTPVSGPRSHDLDAAHRITPQLSHDTDHVRKHQNYPGYRESDLESYRKKRAGSSSRDDRSSRHNNPKGGMKTLQQRESPQKLDESDRNRWNRDRSPPKIRVAALSISETQHHDGAHRLSGASPPRTKIALAGVKERVPEDSPWGSATSKKAIPKKREQRPAVRHSRPTNNIDSPPRLFRGTGLSRQLGMSPAEAIEKEISASIAAGLEGSYGDIGKVGLPLHAPPSIEETGDGNLLENEWPVMSRKLSKKDKKEAKKSTASLDEALEPAQTSKRAEQPEAQMNRVDDDWGYFSGYIRKKTKKKNTRALMLGEAAPASPMLPEERLESLQELEWAKHAGTAKNTNPQYRNLSSEWGDKKKNKGKEGRSRRADDTVLEDSDCIDSAHKELRKKQQLGMGDRDQIGTIDLEGRSQANSDRQELRSRRNDTRASSISSALGSFDFDELNQTSELSKANGECKVDEVDELLRDWTTLQV